MTSSGRSPNGISSFRKTAAISFRAIGHGLPGIAMEQAADQEGPAPVNEAVFLLQIALRLVEEALEILHVQAGRPKGAKALRISEPLEHVADLLGPHPIAVGVDGRAGRDAQHDVREPRAAPRAAKQPQELLAGHVQPGARRARMDEDDVAGACADQIERAPLPLGRGRRRHCGTPAPSSAAPPDGSAPRPPGRLAVRPAIGAGPPAAPVDGACDLVGHDPLAIERLALIGLLQPKRRVGLDLGLALQRAVHRGPASSARATSSSRRAGRG